MALTLLATNNAESTLASAISATDTSLIVSAGTGAEFPDAVAGESYFKLTLTDAATGSQVEIVNVTAKAGDIFTIERAQEGTLAREWAANDFAANMMTADTLNVIAQYTQQAGESAAQAAEYADNAAEYALNKFTFYKTPSDPDGTIAGLAATTNGQSFRVAEGPEATSAFKTYENQNGVAVLQASEPGTAAVTGTIREFPTLASAQADADAGNIPVGSTAYYRSTDDSALAIEVINNGGTLEDTGRKMISQSYVDTSLNTVNKRFTSSDTTEDAINMKDSVGRQAQKIMENGTVQTHTADIERLLTNVGDDGWLVKMAEDSNGNVAAGVDAQGNTRIAKLIAGEIELENPVQAVNVLAKFTVSPNQFEGTSQHDRIEAALTFLERRGGEGVLELGIDTISVPNTSTWIRNSALLAHDNLTISLNASTLKLADGVFDNIIRNKGVVIDPANPNGVALELNENRNIKIIGSGKDECFIEGPDVPYTAPHPINGGEPVQWVGDWYGWRTIGILLANCKNYELTGFTMRKTTCWGISQERGCDNMYIHDIGFDTTVKNGDGIDFRMGCSNGLVENINGNTSDDTVAMTALLNWQSSYPSGNYIWPLQVSGDASHPLGDNIENITVRNIKSSSLANQVRLLITNGAKMNNITVSDIEDSGVVAVTQVLVQTGAYGAPSQIGDMTNITINGIVSNYSNLPLNIDVPIKDSQFNFIRQRKSGGQVYKLNADHPSYPVVNTTVTNAKAE